MEQLSYFDYCLLTVRQLSLTLDDCRLSSGLQSIFHVYSVFCNFWQHECFDKSNPPSYGGWVKISDWLQKLICQRITCVAISYVKEEDGHNPKNIQILPVHFSPWHSDLFLLQVHYYEDGNVQTVCLKDIKSSVKITDEERTAKELMRVVESCENDFQVGPTVLLTWLKDPFIRSCLY
jgi:hypothetical protein